MANATKPLNPLMHIVFNEVCLRGLTDPQLSDPASSADEFFSAYSQDLRFEALCLTGISMCVVIALLQLGGVPQCSSLKGYFCFVLWTLAFVGQYFVLLASFITYALGFASAMSHFSPCLTRWPDGKPFLGVFAGLTFVAHPGVIQIMALMQVYFTAMVSVLGRDHLGAGPSAVIIMLHGAIFLVLPIAYSLLVFVGSLSIVFSVCFMPISVIMAILAAVLFVIVRLTMKVPCEQFKRLTEQLFWWTFDEETARKFGDEVTATFYFALRFYCAFFLISPMIVWGVFLALYIYEGHSHEEQQRLINAVYEFTFAIFYIDEFSFAWPRCLSVEMFSPESLEEGLGALSEIHNYIRMPPADVIAACRVLTFLNFLVAVAKPIIAYANLCLSCCRDEANKPMAQAFSDGTYKIGVEELQ